jgi:hypothetical protein
MLELRKGANHSPESIARIEIEVNLGELHSS